MIIVLNGAESTGKSTLGKHLAELTNGIYLPEYAREYVEALNRQYTFDDVVNIANKQIEQLAELAELSSRQPKKLFFVDTDLIITKIWFKHKYGIVPDFIDKAIRESNIDLYLLCMPDISFEPDPTRENPQLREQLTSEYLSEIQAINRPYSIIQGINNERLKNALEAVTSFMANHNK